MVVVLDGMGLEEEWLSQILGDSTRKAYRRQLGYFMDFIGVKSAENLIKLREKERNFETRIIQFYQWLQSEKGLSGNSARACIIPLQSLFSYAGASVRIKNKLPRMHMRVEVYRPSLTDLQSVYRLNGIETKCWLSLSRDCPARMSDLLTVTSEQIQKGEFLLLSKKENVTGKVYISDSTRALYEQLSKAGKSLPKTQKGIDKLMTVACRVAGLPHRLNQHLLRKLWISCGINLGLNDTIIKILAFKSVPPEQLTYFLDRQDLRDSWQRVVDALPLEGVTNGRITDLQREHAEMELVMKTLAKYMLELQKKDRSYKSLPRDLKILQDFLDRE